MKKNLTILFVLLAAMACTKEAANQGDEKTTYELLTLAHETVNTTSSYSASIRGKQDIEIFPQVGGYLAQVRVTEGEKVQKDQVLFVIEQAPYIAALESAKATVEMGKAGVSTAELNYNNAKKLREKNIVSDADLALKANALAQAKAQLAQAEAQLMSAQTNLDFTVIKSPSNGVVGKIPYRQGALVSGALPQSLTVVSDNSEMFVYFSMSENQVLDLIDQYGSMDSVLVNMPQATLQLNNGSIYTELGKIESISGVIESNTGAVSIRAVFPNTERKLLSGGAGTVLLTETHANSIVIPKAATFELQEKYFVYRVVDKKAQSVEVKISPKSTDTNYIVTSGLAEGDIIIASGAGLVRQGAVVNQ